MLAECKVAIEIRLWIKANGAQPAGENARRDQQHHNAGKRASAITCDKPLRAGKTHFAC